MKKSKLKQIIKEETSEILKEYQADLSVMSNAHLGKFKESLKKFQRRTKSPEWKVELAKVIRKLDKLQADFYKTSKKLGIIPLSSHDKGL